MTYRYDLFLIRLMQIYPARTDDAQRDMKIESNESNSTRRVHTLAARAEKAKSFVDKNSHQPTAECCFSFELGSIARGSLPAIMQRLVNVAISA